MGCITSKNAKAAFDLIEDLIEDKNQPGQKPQAQAGAPSYAGAVSQPEQQQQQQEQQGNSYASAAGHAAAPPQPNNAVSDVLLFPDGGQLPCRNWLQSGDCRRGDSCTYAHRETSLVKLLKYIRTAASTLDICIFTLTCDDIANAILDRHTAGVKVRVICDDDQASSQGSDIGKLKSAGIQVVDDNSQYHMHHKFGIIDGRLLINGSLNWTVQGVTSNQENTVVTSDPALIAQFQNRFAQMWAQFADGAAAQPAVRVAPASNSAAEVLFFPDGQLPCRRWMEGYLKTAVSTLDVCVFNITCDDIANAILERHAAGVKVRVICDDDQAKSNGSDIGKLKDAGIQVVDDNSPYHMHNKFGIINGRLLISGSLNWTIQGVLSNQENAMVTMDTSLISQFQAYFDNMWRSFA